MWRDLAYSALVALVMTTALHLFLEWGEADEQEIPDNDDAIRERMERMRDAGSEVGL